MKKLIVAVLAVCATVAAAQTVVNGNAQINIPTTNGTVTLYRVGGAWELYIGNGQPSVWHGTQAEFERWTHAACGAAQAFAP